MKNLREDQQPYGKVQNNKSMVALAELISLIIGNGKSKQSLELAERLLEQRNIHELHAMSAQAIVKLGVTPLMAAKLSAALELATRLNEEDAHLGTQIRSSLIASIELNHIKHLQVEEFWVLLLSRSNRVVAKVMISRGGITGTVVDKRVIFKTALEHNATGLILSHNHPSGNLHPSQADIDVTKEIIEAGKVMGIKVLDHLIMSSQGYYSFADEATVSF